MAVVKVFDANGVKTVDLMGNVNEQVYDPKVVYEFQCSESEDDDTSEE